MTKTLTASATELLTEAAKAGVVTVLASRIVDAAELITAGYAEARDDTDGPWITLTEAGKSAAHGQ